MISLAGSCPRANLFQIVFFVWVTLSEQKWVILAERRGAIGVLCNLLGFTDARPGDGSHPYYQSAHEYARSNVSKLARYVREGYDIVGTSTSCTLAIKHEYHSVLGLDGPELELMSKATYDIFEYLALLDDEGLLNTRFSVHAGR